LIKKYYDIVIVGAGPAGCTAALYAHKYNLSCLVIDKASFPRDKICGDAFMPVCETILNELNLSFNDIHSSDYCLVTKVNFYSEEEKLEVPTSVFNCKRSVFDNYLYTKTNKAVLVLQNAKPISLIKTNLEISGLFFEWQNEVYEVNCKYVVGADGASSKIRRLADFPKMNDYAIACRSYLPIHKELPMFSIKYLKDVTPGYFWIFKVNKDEVNVGTILFDRHDENLKIRHKQYVMRFLEVDIQDKQINFWQLPFTKTASSISRDGCFLIGDAAGLIDPLIGHGIDTAMISAKVCIESIATGNTKSNVSMKYQEEITRKILDVGNINRCIKDKLTMFQSNSNQLLLDEYLTHLNKGHLNYNI